VVVVVHKFHCIFKNSNNKDRRASINFFIFMIINKTIFYQNATQVEEDDSFFSFLEVIPTSSHWTDFD